MPNVRVGYNQQTGQVEFSPNGGNVRMRGRGRIFFTPADPEHPVVFQSFTLNPEYLAQFPRTVTPGQIDVDDRFTDTQEKSYEYTVVVKVDNGATKAGDPQIVNQPGAMAGVGSGSTGPA